MKLPATLVLLSLSLTSVANAVEIECTVTKKLSYDVTYTSAQLSSEKPSVLIEETPAGITVSRCGYSGSAGKVTCDPYPIDKVEKTKRFNPTTMKPEVIAKYYLFSGHFDVQVFPDLSFIENNGRGLISFGACSLRAP